MKKAHLLLLILPLITGVFYLRALVSWRPKLVFQVPPTRPREAVKQLAFSSDGKMLAVGIAGAGEVGGWPRLHSVTALNAGANFAQQWQWGPSASSPSDYKDGRFLSFLGQDSAILLDGNLGLWEAMTGKVLFDTPTLSLGCMTLSSDQKWLASNYDYLLPRDQKSINQRHRERKLREQRGKKPEGYVFLYKSLRQKQGGLIFTRLKALSLPPTSLANTFSFSPSGARFVLPVGDERGAHLDFYDTNTWTRIQFWSDWKPVPAEKLVSPHFPYSLFVRWSSNGRFLLSGWLTHWSASNVNLWRVSDGKRLSSSQTPLTVPPTFPEYEVQNDGHLISWGIDGNVYQSQGASLTFQPKPLLSLPQQTITAATISPDGTTLVVGTAKGAYTLRLK
ncbi:hypothetical protein IAD21_00638 [Abditibacteriota bacterium]|nr:hypothetical protein IAD21_00638 [Abditibacteriota bacterium]